MQDTYRALAWFAHDWHGGGASRGYRLLCKALRACHRHGMPYPLNGRLTPRQQTIYDHLEHIYALAI